MMQTTSLAAYASIADSLGALQSRVFQAVWNLEPCTDEAIINATGLAPNSARPRRIELVSRGLIENSGLKLLTKSGRRAIAWRVKR